MALWIQNVTPDFAERTNRGLAHDYEVKINNQPPLATFQHDPILGVVACLRSAADAIEAAQGLTEKGGE